MHSGFDLAGVPGRENQQCNKGESLNDDVQVEPEEIHEVIGIAATYLMHSQRPVKPSNLVMVLRAQSSITTDPRQKRVLDAARQLILEQVTYSA